jgi:hypothetical protein
MVMSQRPREFFDRSIVVPNRYIYLLTIFDPRIGATSLAEVFLGEKRQLDAKRPTRCQWCDLRASRRPKSIGFIGFPKADFGRVIPYTRP